MTWLLLLALVLPCNIKWGEEIYSGNEEKVASKYSDSAETSPHVWMQGSGRFVGCRFLRWRRNNRFRTRGTSENTSSSDKCLQHGRTTDQNLPGNVWRRNIPTKNAKSSLEAGLGLASFTSSSALGSLQNVALVDYQGPTGKGSNQNPSEHTSQGDATDFSAAEGRSSVASRAESFREQERESRQAVLPDVTKTPGVAVPRKLRRNVCAVRWGRDVRHVTDAMKKKIAAAYGVPWKDHAKYEFDHLIPRELGGADAIENVWPQPHAGEWNAHRKDVLENRLHRLVCAQQLDIDVAQEAIRADWVAAYKRYVPAPAMKGNK